MRKQIEKIIRRNSIKYSDLSFYSETVGIITINNKKCNFNYSTIDKKLRIYNNSYSFHYSFYNVIHKIFCKTEGYCYSHCLFHGFEKIIVSDYFSRKFVLKYFWKEKELL